LHKIVFLSGTKVSPNLLFASFVQNLPNLEAMVWNCAVLGITHTLHILQTFKSKDCFRGFEVFGKESEGEGLRKRYLGIRGFSPYLCADI
jgi:hypothetical protein